MGSPLAPPNPVLGTHILPTSYPHLDTGVYNYPPPAGFGDTFYIYCYDAFAAGLQNGQMYSSLSFPIQQGQGDFVHRYMQGFDSVSPSVNVYDWQKKTYFSDMANLGLFRQGMVVLPEKVYPWASAFQFDLGPVNMTQVGADDAAFPVYASQLVFSGVRRTANDISDPAPSLYKWYSKPYHHTVIVSVTNFAQVGGVIQPSLNFRININDFDFELWRIEAPIDNAGRWATTNNVGSFPFSPFKIQLYDTNREIVSNMPVIADYFLHQRRSATSPLAFFPCPPMLYRVNSAIRFDIWSLLTQSGPNTPFSLPADFMLDFVGIQRIPC